MANGDNNTVTYGEFNPVKEEVIELKTKMDIQIPALQKSVDGLRSWQIATVTTIILGIVALLIKLSIA